MYYYYYISFRFAKLLTKLLDPPTDIYTSIIIPSSSSSLIPWQHRDVTAIRIRFPLNTTANNYTAEILGVATAASLPLPLTHIYTDAKGIVTSVTKSLQQPFNSTFTKPQLPRNYMETGLLYKHIILNSHKFELHHIKAHQEDTTHAATTEHGTGNRIADLIAQGNISTAASLCNTLKLHTCEFNDNPTPSCSHYHLWETPVPS